MLCLSYCSQHELWRVQITSFQQPSTAVTINPDRGLTWSLSGVCISLHGDWHMSVRFISKITDHGTLDANASDASFSVSVALGESATGEPTIRTTGCTCRIDQLRIRLHGGASWLYNIFMKFVERRVRDGIQRIICEHAKNAVNNDWPRKLASLPMEVPLGLYNQWLFDYRLVSPPALKSGYVESFYKGEFFNAGDWTEAPFRPSPLPSPSTADHMVTVWVSNYVLNTVGYVLQKRGVLHYNLTMNKLPEKFRGRLNTTCSVSSGCIGALVPCVGGKFPNASAELEMFASAAPMVGIDPQKIIGSFAGVVVFRARLSDGSLAHLFGINITAKITVAPRLDGTVLKASVASSENVLAIFNSSVGPISTTSLQDFVRETFIFPKLNEAGEQGLTLLPNNERVKFTNAGIRLENDCIRFFTDVVYTPSTCILYFRP